MRFRLLIFASVLAGGAASAAAGAPVDTEPRPVRWHVLPPEITDAFVARDGRPLYVIERDGEPGQPEVIGDVVVGARPVLLDRSGRLWCVLPDGRRMVGIKDDHVISAEPSDGASFRTVCERGGHREMRTAAYEDAAGRVWFGNSRGVQWYDGRRWRAKDLAAPAGLADGIPMSAVHITEDEAGTLYFWARWLGGDVCGTHGFWTYDGADWKHLTGAVGLDPAGNRLAAVWPIAPGRLLVNAEDGRLVEFLLESHDREVEIAPFLARLNDRRWSVRQEATGELIAMGRRVEPALRLRLAEEELPEEVRARLRMALGAVRSDGPRRPAPRVQGDIPVSLQHLKSGRWTVRLIPPADRRLARGRNWTAVVEGPRRVRDARRMLVLLRADVMETVFVEGAAMPPASVSVLDAGDDGVWIGIKGRGLFRWTDGRLEPVLDGDRGDFWRIIGLDREGRILLSDGERVAALWPGRPEAR